MPYIDKDMLKRMYELKIGVLSKGKVFYPIKARSCKNCLFEDYDLHKMKSRGCTFFESKNRKPVGICIPVRDISNMSEIHVDNVGVWITKNLVKN